MSLDLEVEKEHIYRNEWGHPSSCKGPLFSLGGCLQIQKTSGSSSGAQVLGDELLRTESWEKSCSHGRQSNKAKHSWSKTTYEC